MLILSIPRAAAGNRTQDLFLTKEVLYRLSYSSDQANAECGTNPRQCSRPSQSRKRAMGFEPTTSCLEGRNSTAELHPHGLGPTGRLPFRVPSSAFPVRPEWAERDSNPRRA